MKQETFESFATDYIAEQSNRAREYGMVYQALKQGANWQKEQDKELIEELLGIINATMCYREYSTVTEREKAEAMFGKIRIHFQL